MSARRPTENEMQVLRNLEAGRDFMHGMRDDVAVPAMFQCLLNGWASRNRITTEGRAILAPEQPIKGNYTITVLKEEKPKTPILLPPIGGWRREEPS